VAIHQHHRIGDRAQVNEHDGWAAQVLHHCTEDGIWRPMVNSPASTAVGISFS
jgi:hypothetical protein